MLECANEEVPILRLLPILQRLVKMTDVHKRYGLTKSQIIVLIAIYYKESVTMGEIAQYIGSSKEQATRAVAVLCENELVERFELPDNRTHVYIRFTEKGYEFMQQIREQLSERVSSKIEDCLNPEEVQQLYKSIRVTVQLLCKVK